MNNFYVTLPSNASMDIHPDNAISHYTTRLRQPLDLDGKWEVALVEASVPTRWTNVKAGDCAMRVHLDAISDEEIHDENGEITGFKKISQYFTKSLRDTHYERPIDLSWALNRAWRELRDSIVAPYGEYNEFNKKIPRGFLYNPEENFIKLNPKSMKNEKTHIQVTGKLGLMLGIGDGKSDWVNVPNREMRPVPVEVDHVYLYTDIVDHVVVGHAVAPLLRIIPMKSFIGNNYIEHYTHVFNKPHYLPVSLQHIESIHIDLRNDQGQNIPFITGRSIVKLHFRRRKLL